MPRRSEQAEGWDNEIQHTGIENLLTLIPACREEHGPWVMGSKIG